MKKMFKYLSVVLFIAAIILGIYFYGFKSQESIDLPAEAKTEIQIATGTIPVTLSIPKIEVEAYIQDVGLTKSGKMGTPSGKGISIDVAWYRNGPRPGEVGNSVIAGHVDAGFGYPAVFYDLSKLEAGDRFSVTYEDGQTMTFEVKEKQSYKLSEAPLEKIFGKTDRRMLNLITCNGNFNPLTGRYDERLVVFAELI